MDALLMAGGKGLRLNSGEKPLAMLHGKSLIDYVVDALLSTAAIKHIYVAVSAHTPATRAHVEQQYRDTDRVLVLVTPGEGYVEDTIFAVKRLELFRPFLILSSDIPLVMPGTIEMIVQQYTYSGTEALSVRVDRSCVPEGVSADTVLTDNGVENVPAAINIIDGRHMDRYQCEAVLILKDPLLAANVNYMADLSACERLMPVREIQKSENSINRQVH